MHAPMDSTRLWSTCAVAKGWRHGTRFLYKKVNCARFKTMQWSYSLAEINGLLLCPLEDLGPCGPFKIGESKTFVARVS